MIATLNVWLKEPAVSFENEAEAKKWCDGYNNM